MKWSREKFVRILLIWVFLFQKYNKFGSVLLIGHFIKHKPLIYEECQIISRVQILLTENRETSLR